MVEISKGDWKLYKEKISGWQKSYIEKLCENYVALLTDESVDADQRFWTLERRMREDRRKPGVLIELSRSNMLFDLARLVSDQAISLDDLKGFSFDVQEAVRMILRL